MLDAEMPVAERIMGQLPHSGPDGTGEAVNVFELYDAVDADPDAFRQALIRLQWDDHEMLRPGLWEVTRIDGEGGSN